MHHSSNELIRDSIGSVTQIECRSSVINRTAKSKLLIRNLVIKSDNPRQEVILIEVREQHAQNRLLHILHTGRLHGDNSRSLQRLRYEGNLYRYLRARFEEVNSCQLVIKAPVRKEILAGREAGLFETFGPDHLTELLVSLKSISGRSWAVPWYVCPSVDISIRLGEHTTIEHVRHRNELAKIALREFIVEQTDFLLTLDIIRDGI
jgi:hypothetical protein